MNYNIYNLIHYFTHNIIKNDVNVRISTNF